jgi:hypothetical protein
MVNRDSMLIDIYSTFRVKYENRYTGISYFENDFKKNLINNEIHLIAFSLPS